MSPKSCPTKIPAPCPLKAEETPTSLSNESILKADIPKETGGPKGKKCYDIWHPGFDARFPHHNQSRRCWQNFVDFYRCQARLGEDDTRCEYYRKAFTALCPDFWLEKFEEQRENGTFPASLE